MFNQHNDRLVRRETICGIMLKELQEIWDEVGETEPERDSMLEEIEQKCLEVYRRKMDEAIECRAQMQQEIAKIRTEISNICFALGEQPPHVVWKPDGGLKSELESVVPQLVEMRRRKLERKNELFELIDQLEKISNEISGSREDGLYKMIADETDLSLKRQQELRARLLDYQNEKRDRQKQVENLLRTLNLLCSVLGVDFEDTICEIHPTLNDSKGVKDMSNNTIESLTSAVARLREVKKERWEKLQIFATSLLELWNLMDIPMVEQNTFRNVTSKFSASVSEITETNMLSVKFLNHVEAEVSRLEQLRSSKLRDLVMKKRFELEEICRRAHIVAEAHGETEYSTEVIESEILDPECLWAQIELQIARAKEEALSRKEILEKVEKWLTACQEECWLEEYNKDDKRYHAGRGSHLALKRAEKARAVMNKIPAMVDILILKTKAWEKERGVEFLYDSEPLLAMLEQYNVLKQEKELEMQRQRDQKKLKGQLIVEMEALYGTKPSPSSSGKKGPKITLTGPVSRKNSKPEKAAPIRHPKKAEYSNQKSSINRWQHGGFAASSSSGKRNSEFPGDSPLIRKPFTPVSYRVLSKANIAASPPEDDNKRPKKDNTTMQRKLLNTREKNNQLWKTPKKPIVVCGGENKTSSTMPISMPRTPSSAASVAMLTLLTPPTPPCFSSSSSSFDGPTEYSFEEVRAGFIRPSKHLGEKREADF